MTAQTTSWTQPTVSAVRHRCVSGRRHSSSAFYLLELPARRQSPWDHHGAFDGVRQFEHRYGASVVQILRRRRKIRISVSFPRTMCFAMASRSTQLIRISASTEFWSGPEASRPSSNRLIEIIVSPDYGPGNAPAEHIGGVEHFR